MRPRRLTVSPRAAALAALSVGALFYFARPVDPIAVAWLDAAGFSSLAHAVHDARAYVFTHTHSPRWFRGSASDAAYAFSLGAFVARAPRGVRALGAFLAIAHELAQGLRVVSGTFDAVDLVVLTAFFSFACALFRAPTRARFASLSSANPRVTESS